MEYSIQNLRSFVLEMKLTEEEQANLIEMLCKLIESDSDTSNNSYLKECIQIARFKIKNKDFDGEFGALHQILDPVEHGWSGRIGVAIELSTRKKVNSQLLNSRRLP